jgi:two-component system cell cycle sensor histidine kinase/response regulator CckA
MKKIYWLACIVILLIIICGFLFASFYSVAKNDAIRNLNQQQSLHAIQAARGIEEFFGNWTRILETYSGMDNIVGLDDKGKQYMAHLYEANKGQIRSVIRVDANGRIIYVTPYSQESIIGKDISGQKHIQEIIHTHKPVVSDVFKTVQGFDAIALHVPVFRNKTFVGSIGITVNYASLAKRYVEGIKIGKTGYAWMISRDGTELFCPVPGHTGRSVFENCKGFPSILAMAGEMLKGHQGVTTYSFDKIAGKTVKPVKKHAVYMPVPIGNTFWSIVVASSEDEVLASLAGFRNRLLLIIGLILLGATLFTYYGGKAWFIIEEEEKRKRVEEALREEQRRLEEIIDVLPDATLVIDKTGKVTAWNRAIEKMTGVKAEEMIGKGNYEYAISFYGERRPILIDLAIIPDDEFLTGHYDNINRRETILSGEVFAPKTYGGKGAYIWATSSTLINADGNIIGAIESIRDITKRKTLENALRESEEKYRELVENANSIILRMDSTGKITFFNDYASRFLGFSHDEIIGRNVIGTIMPPIDSAGKDLTNMIRDIGAHRELYRNNENENICKNGTRVWVAWTNTPILDDQGRCVEILCIGNDITERRKMQEELLKTQKLESLGVLAGGIAHDFNNLLTGILGNISMAKIITASDSKALKRLDEAEKAVWRARDLTQQLMTFAKGGAPVKKTAAMEQIVMDSASFVLRGSNVRCEFAVPEEVWPVEVDEGQMNQVINNLIINADQSMVDGGIIEVGIENLTIAPGNEIPLKEGRYVKITIRDHGAGIPEQYLHRIFDPYFTTKKKGSGLGLASVYSIIRNHDGYVGVESTVGAGTTFQIYIPASENCLPEVMEIKEKLQAGSGRVLLMDDEEIIRDVAADILVHLGYSAVPCCDGSEAIELYRQAIATKEPFAAVIMDLTIPGGMGGREAAARILEIDPDAVLIVSSGYSSGPVVANFRQYGFSGVVSKPFDAEGLARELKRLIPNKS